MILNSVGHQEGLEEGISYNVRNILNKSKSYNQTVFLELITKTVTIRPNIKIFFQLISKLKNIYITYPYCSCRIDPYETRCSYEKKRKKVVF